MHLLIDAGNTRTKLALYQPTQPIHQIGAVPRAEPELLPNLLHGLPPIQGILGCNVTGSHAAKLIEQHLSSLGRPIDWKTAQRHCLGVTTHYEDISQLGPDRWLSVIAASQQSTQNVLVINAGTALTIDALTSSRDYLGGTICPGWSLMRDALANHTARLGRPDGEWQSFPNKTSNAIISGIINSLVGAIEQMVKELAPYGPFEACLLSGGDADIIAPRITLPLVRVENLVLQGLAALLHTTPDESSSPSNQATTKPT
jgi:type III pantothenate kinase